MLKRKEVIMNNGIYRVIQEELLLWGTNILMRQWLEHGLNTH